MQDYCIRRVIVSDLEPLAAWLYTKGENGKGRNRRESERGYGDKRQEVNIRSGSIQQAEQELGIGCKMAQHREFGTYI